MFSTEQRRCVALRASADHLLLISQVIYLQHISAGRITMHNWDAHECTIGEARS